MNVMILWLWGIIFINLSNCLISCIRWYGVSLVWHRSVIAPWTSAIVCVNNNLSVSRIHEFIAYNSNSDNSVLFALCGYNFIHLYLTALLVSTTKIQLILEPCAHTFQSPKPLPTVSLLFGGEMNYKIWKKNQQICLRIKWNRNCNNMHHTYMRNTL